MIATDPQVLANLDHLLDRFLNQASREKILEFSHKFSKKVHDKTQISSSALFTPISDEILSQIANYLTIEEIGSLSNVILKKNNEDKGWVCTALTILLGCDISKRSQALLHATKRGEGAIVCLLSSRVSQNVLKKAYIIAAQYNSLKILQELENIVKIDDKTMGTAYQEACRSGSSSIVRNLEQKLCWKVNHVYERSTGLLWGVKINKITEISLKGIDVINLIEALVQAARLGSNKAVNTLINSSRFDDIPADDLGRALWVAAEEDHDVVLNALISSSRFDDIPADYLGKTLQVATAKGHLSIVDALISSSRFSEISANDLGKAFEVATVNGHDSVIEVLISSSRFNEIYTTRLGKALQLAATKGHSSIVNALIHSNRFCEISANDLGGALWLAATKGHGFIVAPLINHSRFDEIPIDYLRKALRAATKKDHGAIADALISSSRCGDIPANDLEKTAQIAAEKSRGTITDPLINPSHFKKIFAHSPIDDAIISRPKKRQRTQY